MKEPGSKRRWHRLLTAAEEEVRAVLESLPKPVKGRAVAVPVTYEPWPGRHLIEDGFDPDLLGLFVGNSISASVESDEALPAQIILFLESIWDYSNHDAEIFREEVRRTYLHELGHYLGLDEDDMISRDLD